MPSSSPTRRVIRSSNRSIEVPNSNFQDDHMVTSSIGSGLNDDALRELCLVLVTNNMIEDIESLFVTELEGLTLTASSSEILIRLSRINIILSLLDFHFRACLVYNLRKHLKKLSSDLNSESTLIVSQQVIVALRSYMIFNYISALPEGLLHDIYGWLSIENYQSLMYVCKEWHHVARNETQWKIFYYAKFSVRNSIESEIKECYFSAYRNRLLNPLVNDYVEIAWRGKFRLEGLDVYRGLAWWNAKIVDRHVSQGKYKVHYEGWEDRWDEWVTRSRVRWPFNPTTTCNGTSKIIKRDDVVEVWCQGRIVPGAWLEARVKRIRGARLQLDKIQMNELPLWVNQHQVRVLERPYDQDGNDRTVEEILDGEQLYPVAHIAPDVAVKCGIL